MTVRNLGRCQVILVRDSLEALLKEVVSGPRVNLAQMPRS